MRSTGIVVPSAIWPDPAGSMAKNMSPSSVLTFRSAREVGPNWESVLMRNPTWTLSPSSSMLSTAPTRTPAMRTSSPTLMPPASEKLA